MWWLHWIVSTEYRHLPLKWIKSHNTFMQQQIEKKNGKHMGHPKKSPSMQHILWNGANQTLKWRRPQDLQSVPLQYYFTPQINPMCFCCSCTSVQFYPPSDGCPWADKLAISIIFATVFNFHIFCSELTPGFQQDYRRLYTLRDF